MAVEKCSNYCISKKNAIFAVPTCGGCTGKPEPPAPFLEGLIIDDFPVLDTNDPFEGDIFTVLQFLQPTVPAKCTAHFFEGEPALGEYEYCDFCCAFVRTMLKAAKDIVIRPRLRSGDLALHTIPCSLCESLADGRASLFFEDDGMAGFVTDILGGFLVFATTLIEVILNM